MTDPTPAAAASGRTRNPRPRAALPRPTRGSAAPVDAELEPPRSPVGPGSSATPAPKDGHKKKKIKKNTHKAGARQSEKSVELVVEIPKSLRTQLRARADELGLTTEQTAARVIAVWLEG